jgi:hypothetical protein
MPLNAQAEMGRVLAIEPEASQADALRQFVRDELGAELMLVSSYAAVVAINRQTPDVVLSANRFPRITATALRSPDPRSP